MITNLEKVLHSVNNRKMARLSMKSRDRITYIAMLRRTSLCSSGYAQVYMINGTQRLYKWITNKNN